MHGCGGSYEYAMHRINNFVQCNCDAIVRLRTQFAASDTKTSRYIQIHLIGRQHVSHKPSMMFSQWFSVHRTHKTAHKSMRNKYVRLDSRHHADNFVMPHPAHLITANASFELYFIIDSLFFFSSLCFSTWLRNTKFSCCQCYCCRLIKPLNISITDTHETQ